MKRTLAVAIVVFTSSALVSCSDNPSQPSRAVTRTPANVIADGSSGADPDFFWLPPTVATAPAFTGSFDATALDQLAIEICELGADGACTGAPIERFTSSSALPPNRIALDTAGQFYTADWKTGLDRLDDAKYYRVRALRGAFELGVLDVDPVRTPTDLASVDQTSYVGVFTGQTLTLRFRVQLATALTRVKINEVESRLENPPDNFEVESGDWIELYNSASVPVSIGGYVLRPQNDAFSFAIPAGTTIPAHGLYVVSEPEFGFSLGAPDEVRFFAPDSFTLIDSFAWTTHASNTYARCPNGTGAFVTPTTVTKGAVNDCSPPKPLKINEAFWSFAQRGWFELYNPGTAAVDLSGYSFVPGAEPFNNTFQLRPGTTIEPSSYLVIDGADYGFTFGGSSELHLYMPDHQAQVDALGIFHNYNGIPPVNSIGRCPDGTGAFAKTAAVTKGTANVCTPP